MSRNKGIRSLAAALIAASALPLMGSSLIDPSSIEEKQTEYTVAQAEIGSIVKEMTASASIYKPTYVDVRCKVYDARVAEIGTFRSDIIEEGTKLGVLRSESSRANVAQTELNLKRARENYAFEIQEREEAINEKQIAVQQTKGGYDREIAKLELRRMELSLEEYRLKQEKTIAELEKTLAEQQEQLLDVEVIAPVTGKVTHFSYVSAGDSIGYNSVLLTLQTSDPTLIRLEDPNGVWRYGMECTVEYGPRNNRKNAPARIISADNVLSPTESTGYAYAQILGEFNEEDATIINVSGEEFRLDNVLLIPKKAASLYQGQNRVSILNGSSTANRYVRTDLSDKTNIWVLQGLDEGQTVILD